MSVRNVQLGEVTETVMGQAPPGSECNKGGEGTPFVKAGEFSDVQPIVREWTTRPLKLARSGDVLVCVVGATAGKVNLAVDCAIGRSVAAVRPKPGALDTSYLHRYLQTKVDHLRGLSQGLAQGVITREMLSALRIPLPPLPEQRRIAAILDKADALRRKRKRAIELLDSLTQSIFLEMFGESAEQLAVWGKTVPLADVAEIGSGITKGRKTSGASLQTVPYLAVANVQDRKLNLSMVKTIEASKNEIERYRLADGDLLLTEGGDPDKLGRGTLWRDELPVAIHQNHIFRVRIRSEEILPLFLNWLVGSRYGKSYFLSVAKQTTGIASINKTQLSAFPVVLPPLPMQRQFVALAEKIASRSAQLASGNVLAGSLFASLQHRAFSGQL